MSRMVLEAERFAEAGVSQQRCAHLKARIAAILAAGLLASLLISTPAWRSLDPLPLLLRRTPDLDLPGDELVLGNR